MTTRSVFLGSAFVAASAATLPRATTRELQAFVAS
jgi:hypothetical protein